jgi:hypothetical protein
MLTALELCSRVDLRDLPRRAGKLCMHLSKDLESHQRFISLLKHPAERDSGLRDLVPGVVGSYLGGIGRALREDIIHCCSTGCFVLSVSARIRDIGLFTSN